MGLRRFSNQELHLSKQDAWQVLRFFFPTGMSMVPPESITDEDRGFAQALLVEAIDASYNMSYVEAAFRSFAGKIPGTLSLAAFAARAARSWFRHATEADLKDPQIYETVRLTLQRNFQTIWQMRVNGLGYTGAYER